MAQIYGNIKLPPELISNIKLLATVDNQSMITYLRVLIEHAKTQRFLKARKENDDLIMRVLEDNDRCGD